MDKTNDGGSAFPSGARQDPDMDRTYRYPLEDGMSLRDYFAAAALQGILSDPEKTKQIDSVSKEQKDDAFVVKMNTALAYAYADYMLKAREQ